MEMLPSMGLPGDSVGKEFVYNAGDTRDVVSISGLGGSLGVGLGNPLQYSCLENSMDRGAWWATVHRVAESDTTEVTEHACTRLKIGFEGLLWWYSG